MIDFHSHILPKADHGSDSIETSMFQIKAAKSVGIDTIVATPHFYLDVDNVSDFLKRRETAYNELIQKIDSENIDIKIIKGAEVNLQVDLFSLDDLSSLCIQGTNYMLLEMPMDVAWTSWHYDAVDAIIKQGIKPIIAHINRYSTFYLKKLFEKDALFQINIESFKSLSSRSRIMKFYRQNYVSLIGSDIHERSNIYSYWKKYQNKYKNMFDYCERNARAIIK